MSLVVTPEILAGAANDLHGIGSAISAGNAAAAWPTTSVVAAATDSVSARTAAFFAAYAQQYQALSAQAAAFHDQFVQALNAAGKSYADTEAANTASARLASAASWQHSVSPLAGHPGSGDSGAKSFASRILGSDNVGLLNRGATSGNLREPGYTGWQTPNSSLGRTPTATRISSPNPGGTGNGSVIQSAKPAAFAGQNSAATNLGSASTVNNAALTPTTTSPSPTNIALIMGGTGNPQPDPGYVTAVNNLYVQPKYPGYTPVGLYTPEQFWPDTGLTSETFGRSVHQGVRLLNSAIMTQTADGNNVVVVGYSQSATVATLEMRHLDALPASARPSPNQLSFVLFGDPNNPNGGILERFHGLYIPGLNVPFNGATPPNTPYPTTIYTIQYDGWADFPQYPLDVPADLNAIAGIIYLHPTYPDLTSAQLATAVLEPVSPGYNGATSYYMIPTQNLPLLNPVRQIPVVGNPLADLVQPDLRVIVDLGYGNGYANVPTPAGLFPEVNWSTTSANLVLGAQQGVTAAKVDLGLLPASDLPNAYPYVSAYAVSASAPSAVSS